MPNEPQSPQVGSRVLSLENLFAAPLVSVIEADVLAARKFAGFISDFGFAPNGEQSSSANESMNFGRLRTVSFSYRRPGAGGELQDAVVEIPLLSLVPLPLLQVTEADFTFNVHVLESNADELGDAPPLLRTPAKSDDGEEQAAPKAAAPRMRAMLSSASRAPSSGAGSGRSSELDANMSVKLSMKQADVPGGLSAMLQVMSQSITTTTKPLQQESKDEKPA